jgi:hypothetical protein
MAEKHQFKGNFMAKPLNLNERAETICIYKQDEMRNPW